jgi:hypothetical protein
VTWVEGEGVLFVSTTTPAALRDILASLTPGPRTPLTGLELRRLVEAANLERFFSIGKRAMQAGDTSYVTSAGRKAEEGITPADSRAYDLGHAMGRSGDGLFGFSVQRSKVWQPGAADSLFGFRSWCEDLARELANAARGGQPSKLDQLSISDPLSEYPANPLFVAPPPELVAEGAMIVVDGEIVAPELLEFEPRGGASSAHEAVFDINIRGESKGLARFATSGQVMIEGANWLVRVPDGHGHMLVPLEEFLVHEPPSLFFGDGSRAIGDRFSQPLQRQFFPEDARFPEVWDNCDTRMEFGDPADGRQSVGAWTAMRLSRDLPIVIQDHLSGELADFVAINPDANPPRVCLAHCKRSGGNPAARVTDVEVLVAQGVRSVQWLRPGGALWSELRYRLDHRNPTQLITGDRPTVLELLDRWIAAPPLTRWSLWLVQPGLSVARLDDAEDVTALLNIAYSWASSQNVELSLVCSA